MKNIAESRQANTCLDMCSIKKGLKKGDTLLPYFFNFVIMKVQKHQEGLKLNSMHHLIYAYDVNILGGCIHTIKEIHRSLSYC